MAAGLIFCITWQVQALLCACHDHRHWAVGQRLAPCQKSGWGVDPEGYVQQKGNWPSLNKQKVADILSSSQKISGQTPFSHSTDRGRRNLFKGFYPGMHTKTRLSLCYFHPAAEL